MPNPMFSLIMPAYNAEATICESLDHIAAQRYADYEVLIVDDGSADATAEIAQQYAAEDSRIRVFGKPNGGVASVYNHAIPLSRGAFIVIAPSDDLLYPCHLETVARAIAQKPDFHIFCSNGERLFENGERARTYIDAVHQVSRELTLLNVIKASFFSVGVAYKRVLFDRLGGYREDVYGEDWDFWLRAMKQEHARVWYVAEILAGNRVRAENKSSDLDRVFRSDIEILQGFERRYDLCSAEREAVARSVENRRSLMQRVAREWRLPGVIRRWVRQLLMSVFGVERVEQAVARFKSRR